MHDLQAHRVQLAQPLLRADEGSSDGETLYPAETGWSLSRDHLGRRLDDGGKIVCGGGVETWTASARHHQNVNQCQPCNRSRCSDGSTAPRTTPHRSPTAQKSPCHCNPAYDCENRAVLNGSLHDEWNGEYQSGG